MPLGLGMALAKNLPAMEKFSLMPSNDKENFIKGCKGVNSKEEMQDIEDYLGEFSLYEEIHVNGKVFILVHAGLDNFNTARSLDDYELYEVIFKRTNYTKVYYPDKYLVTGHTPTQVIKGNSRPGFIYQKNHHIAIDCGCVFGGKLACLCLETMEEFYV